MLYTELIRDAHWKQEKDVLYFPNITYRPDQALDVYVRRDLWCDVEEGRIDSLPVIVYFHGGAWLLGDKDYENSRGVCHALAYHGGYVAISVSYTLTSISNTALTGAFLGISAYAGIFAMVSTFRQKAYVMASWLVLSCTILLILAQRPNTQTRHPHHVMDCVCAMRWVRDHIREFGGNPHMMSVVGHSAGAHLASIVATNGHYLQQVGMHPKELVAAVCIAGVYNDRALASGGIIARNLLSENFGNDRITHVSAFPIYHADPRSCPPFFLLNAWRDFSLKRQAKEFHSVLLQRKVYVDNKVYPKTNHYNIILGWEECNRQVLDDIIHFIDRAIQVKMPYIDAVEK